MIDIWRLYKDVIVAAPSGKASHLITGQTIHSLLSIPPRGIFKKLSEDKTRALQKTLAGVKTFIIDEYSMVGCTMLHYIDQRLRQITGREQQCFGGLSVILVGDTRQLAPVGDRPLWFPMDSSTSPTNCQGKQAYLEFEIVVLLTIQVRQSGPAQQSFRELLGRLRVCKSTPEDWQLLKTRMIAVEPARRNTVDNSVYLKSKKLECDYYNGDKLEQLARDPNCRVCRIDSLDNGQGVEDMNDDDFGGLERSILLARGAKVMITTNLWVKEGIMNGAIGYVRHIIFAEGHAPPQLPIAVIVELDERYSGPHLPGRPRYVVIEPKTYSALSRGGFGCERTQLPLRV